MSETDRGKRAVRDTEKEHSKKSKENQGCVITEKPKEGYPFRSKFTVSEDAEFDSSQN